MTTQTELSKNSMLSSNHRSSVRARKALGKALTVQIEVSDVLGVEGEVGAGAGGEGSDDAGGMGGGGGREAGGG